MYDGFAVKEYKLNDKNMNLCINKIYGGEICLMHLRMLRSKFFLFRYLFAMHLLESAYDIRTNQVYRTQQ